MDEDYLQSCFSRTGETKDTIARGIVSALHHNTSLQFLGLNSVAWRSPFLALIMRKSERLIRARNPSVSWELWLLYEKHQAKKAPYNKYRHKIQEEVATAVAVGAGGYTFHEHHQKSIPSYSK
ncbi:uncharacterized protein LOC142541672 [Primulina tabacum]|uniref:uncharacterized protein LOC142541672 n=1 Tax=Primulina tabacum TaxID=48773 RepID=UPI003F5A9E61